MPDLKPCPFCGSEKMAVSHINIGRKWGDIQNFFDSRKAYILMYITCCKCDSHGPASKYKAVAIRKWNEAKR